MANLEDRVCGAIVELTRTGMIVAPRTMTHSDAFLQSMTSVSSRRDRYWRGLHFATALFTASRDTRHGEALDFAERQFAGENAFTTAAMTYDPRQADIARGAALEHGLQHVNLPCREHDARLREI